MGHLRIRLFGCPATSRDGGEWQRQITRSATKLLGYLCLHGQRLHARETLADILWSDLPAERARRALKTTLWRLRSRLESRNGTGPGVLIASGGEIGLNWAADVECDATEFYAALEAARAAPSAATTERLRQTLAGLQGELLEGFYDDWILIERECFNAARVRAWVLLMTEANARADIEPALEFGLAALRDDPLRESIHRSVIRLHMALGQRVQALRQYETCRRLIAQELGIEPMPETLALADAILRGECSAEGTLPTGRITTGGIPDRQAHAAMLSQAVPGA